jgi:hypothetical protein
MTLEELWRKKSDEELAEAAAQLEEYTEEAKQVIHAELRRRGLHEALITSTATKVFPPESNFARLDRWIWVGVGFLILNGLLYIGQEWYYADDVRRCDEIKTQLTQMDQEIDSSEEYLQERKRAGREIEELEAKLKQGVNVFGTRSAYLAAYDNYKKLVNQYNREVGSAKQVSAKYQALVEDYNSNVEEYNKLAKSAYSRFYLIPVPRGTSKSLNKRTFSH